MGHTKSSITDATERVNQVNDQLYHKYDKEQ